MNERIQQLADEALRLVADEHTGGDESRLNTDSYHVKDLIQEKFAELMVKKFDDILMLEQLDCIGNMDKKSVLLLDKIRERMKTYFGVEE
jgi:hypothetical protein